MQKLDPEGEASPPSMSILGPKKHRFWGSFLGIHGILGGLWDLVPPCNHSRTYRSPSWSHIEIIPAVVVRNSHEPPSMP